MECPCQHAAVTFELHWRRGAVPASASAFLLPLCNICHQLSYTFSAYCLFILCFIVFNYRSTPQVNILL
ncbi:hypothetical protein NA56DRAFT_377228 [Hyaloscypha hepaticicola]|uniref:Uncharacterized protein n=1 Tax=Hyaloscypha hepaticicola TaxID=2082293 RepID=A0A2J6PK58_9HELO|nr:hypothetical protein NA56DRAFT_377228 [Hyaloscypha hepaticicola]